MARYLLLATFVFLSIMPFSSFAQNIDIPREFYQNVLDFTLCFFKLAFSFIRAVFPEDTPGIKQYLCVADSAMDAMDGEVSMISYTYVSHFTKVL